MESHALRILRVESVAGSTSCIIRVSKRGAVWIVAPVIVVVVIVVVHPAILESSVPVPIEPATLRIALIPTFAIVIAAPSAMSRSLCI